LLAHAVSARLSGKSMIDAIRPRKLFGPDSAPGKTADLQEISWLAFRDAVLDLDNYLDVNRRIPARVFIGADTLRPEDFLVSLASSYLALQKTTGLPREGTVAIGRAARLLPADHVAKDTPGLFGGWVIHKEGYRAPKILEVARLQAWT